MIASLFIVILKTFKKLKFSLICVYYLSFIHLQKILNCNLSKTVKKYFEYFSSDILCDVGKWVLFPIKESFEILQKLRNENDFKRNFTAKYFIFTFLFKILWCFYLLF